MDKVIHSSMEVKDIETVRRDEVIKEIGFLRSTREFLLGHVLQGRNVYFNFVCIGYGMSMPVRSLTDDEITILVRLLDRRMEKLEKNLGCM